MCATCALLLGHGPWHQNVIQVCMQPQRGQADTLLVFLIGALVESGWPKVDDACAWKRSAGVHVARVHAQMGIA